MALEDKARHAAESARGKVKNVAGKAKGDEEMEAEGKAEQVLGHLKQAGEKVKDAVQQRRGGRPARSPPASGPLS